MTRFVLLDSEWIKDLRGSAPSCKVPGESVNEDAPLHRQIRL
jgi:hypothetical protein